MAKKLIALLVAVMMVMAIVPMHAFAAADAKVAPNPWHKDEFVRGYDDDYVPPADGCARVILTVGDVWGDGSGYQMLLDADANAYGNVFPATGALSTSGDVSDDVYAEFEYKIPENADGALTTTNIVLNGSVTIEIPAGIYDWCITNPTPGDRMWIASDQGNVGGRADDYEFEEGYTYEFEVSLMGQNDGTDVTITDPTGYTPDPPTFVLGYYFESEDEIADFTFYDEDADGYTWSLSDSYPFEGSGHMGSKWNSSVNVDNWMIMPEFAVPAVDPCMTLYARARSTSWGNECFGVYVGTDPNDLDTFVQVGETTEVNSTTYRQFEFDLSDYAGESVYVAIRHFNCIDTYYLYIDQIEFWGDEAPNTETIDTIAIEGFTTPAWGENPDFDVTVPGDANYTVEYTAWTMVVDGSNEPMISSDTFDNEDYTYFMSIRVAPAEGYEIDRWAEVTINGDSSIVGYTALNEDGEMIIYTEQFTVEEEVAEPEVIDTIEINGFIAPVWGENPFLNVSVPGDNGYVLDYTDWNWYDSDTDDGGIMDPSDVYNSEDYVYYQYFEITPADGYVFAEDVTVLINGLDTIAENYGWSENGGYFWIYTIDYTVEEPFVPTLIEEVEVFDMDIPEFGATPDFDLSVPDDAPYFITDVSWTRYDDEGDTGMTEDEVFDDPNASYYAIIYLGCEEGYDFPDECTTVTINGEEALVDFSFGYEGEYFIATIDFTVEETTAPDLDEALNVEGGTLHFETSEDYPWEVFEDGDRLAAWSTNNGVANSTSEVWTTVTANAGDVLSFDFMAWGEGSYSYWDECALIVDDAVVMQWGAYQNNDWETYEYTFTTDGEHLVVWSYTKDGSVNPLGDYFAVDEVQINEGEEPPVLEVIDTVEILNFVEPAWGNAPDYGITVPEDAHYYIDDAAWFWWLNGDGDFMGDDDIFNVPSVAYYMGIIIIPEEGYEFADDVTVLINGETEFVAVVYGEEYGLEIYTIDFVVCFYGDVDGDGEVTTADALLAMRYAMGLIDLTEEQLFQMDVNGDGVYDLVDATLILRYAMGIIDHFPVEPDPMPMPQ